MSGQADCCYCGSPASDRYREVVCWETLRTQGGANQMVGRRETGRAVCASCISQIRAGITPGHPRLFG